MSLHNPKFSTISSRDPTSHPPSAIHDLNLRTTAVDKIPPLTENTCLYKKVLWVTLQTKLLVDHHKPGCPA